MVSLGMVLVGWVTLAALVLYTLILARVGQMRERHKIEAPAMTGDTLQAVRRHVKVDPMVGPGEADLSAHVDFRAIGGRAQAAGAEVYGPVSQGSYLGRLGIQQRLQRLLERAAPAQREVLVSGCARLVGTEAMGELFKVMALTAASAPLPPGFAPEEMRR